MDKPTVKIFVFLLIALPCVAAGMLYVKQQNKNAQPPIAIKSPQPKQAYAAGQKPKDVVVPSLDGTAKLVMKQTTNNGETTYTFFMQDEKGIQTQIFSKTANKTESFTIHDNAFSPDGKYVYITGTNNRKPEVYVLKTSGEAFANGEPAVDITAIFSAKDDTYTFDEATGWATPTLLIVESKNDDHSTGPSFWFDTSSLGFIKLARHQ